MATPYAFVTLITSDSYLPGALALVAALKDLHPTPPTPPEVDFQTVCLVTPETVDVASIKLLRRAFNIVIGVEIIEQEDERNLRLLGRLDLSTVLTKLHIFRLTQYSKIIFLDADVLPLRPISHLFSLPHEFSAVPDVGWPDIFNSGVLVITPGQDKFDDLMKLQKSKGSWDGGDQGLLNEWRGSDWNRLSFVYNTTPTAAYTYAPAYERFGSGIAAVHFIGMEKPWKGLLYRSPGIKSSATMLGDGTKRVYNYEALVDRWYDVYDTHYRQEPETQRNDFSLPNYSSVWDDETSIGADFPAAVSMPASGSGGALGLDDLRKAAVEGLNTLSPSSSSSMSASSSEGEYRSMPLEGRVDLMRPQKQPDLDTRSEHNSGSTGEPFGSSAPSHIHAPSADSGYFGNDGPPTPGPHEVPNAPYIHGHSLPPTETSTPYYGPSSRSSSGSQQRPSQFNNSLQVFYHPQTQSEPGPEYYADSHSPHQLHQSHSSQQHQPPQQFQQQQSRNVLFTPQHRDIRYPQDSSDSDTPTPPASRFPPHIARQLPPQQHSQQQSQQHIHHEHSHSQSYRGHQQQRISSDQPIDHWTKEQRPRGSRRPSMETDRPKAVQGRRDSYGQQQQPRRGDITPLQHEYRSQQRPYHTEHRVNSPILSGQITPTQGSIKVQQAHRADGQRGHEPQRSYGQTNDSSHSQLRVHFQHDSKEGRESHTHHQQGHNHPHQHPSASPSTQQHFTPPPRPRSPPKLSWNPAVEPPPKESPPISAFPEDTYFPNVWDQAGDAAYQSSPSPDRQDRAEVFFRLPPQPVIPEQLIREGQYSNVLGHIEQSDHAQGALSPPTPDKNKVRAVFPWEEKPRHVPRRVFPRTDSPPPSTNYIESERTSSPVSTPPIVAPLPVAPQAPSSPIQGIQWGVGFSNAWDSVPSIQKYASKLAGSPKTFPHLFMQQPPPPPDDNWRRQWREQKEKEWQDRQDASSMDGDDEDESESDDEDRQSEAIAKGRGGGTASKRRGSLSKKQYKTRGVQASPETDAKEVQVEIIKADGSIRRISVAVGDDTALAEHAAAVGPSTLPADARPTAPSVKPAPPPPPALNTAGLGVRRQWQQGSPYAPGTALLPSAVPRDFKTEPEQVIGTPTLNTSARPGMPFPSMASPTGLRSPATLGSPRTYSPPKTRSPLRSPPKTPAPSSPLAAPSAMHLSSPPRAVSPVNAPMVRSPRGSVSQNSPLAASPSGLARPGGSPRPPGTPRRASASSLPNSSRTGSPAVSATTRLLPSQSTPSPKHTRFASLTSPLAPSALQRTASVDTNVTPSPSTTNDSVITTPVDVRERRGSRVWDPARGVDVFKRGSEEVLARFLRMGSFDDEDASKQQQQQPSQQQPQQQRQNV
ncbi:hypothetical protein BDW22DRAFT_1349839 [Trametopsis cervina]|nr:hypothetical protein BDW22DRAFT_1349839 [Trametopsis cervina]